MFVCLFVLALALGKCSAARICSAWSVSERGCREFDVGDVNGNFDKQIMQRPRGIFLYSHFAMSHIDLLPHFIEHYTALGVDRSCFLLVWNVLPNEDAALVAEAMAFFSRLGVSVVRWSGVFTSAAAHYNKIELLAPLLASNWVIYADIDEFLELPRSVQAQVAYLESSDYTHESGFTVDRVANGGRLASLRPDATIFEQYPLRCNLTGAHGLATKVIFLRGDLRTVSGNHLVHEDALYERNGQRAPSYGVRRSASPALLTLNHFKWTSDVVPYLQNRIILYKQVQQYWALSSSLLASLQHNNWTINVEKYCRS
jgi:hypothetical protein